MPDTERDADGIVLVTGGAGFLGSHVVRRLVADGRRVRVFVRPTTNVEGLAGLPVEWAYGDVTDREAVAAAVAGCTSIIHCVVNTQAWLRDPAPMRRVNVDGLATVMDAALTEGVRRFVLTSTIATIGRNSSGVSTERDRFNFPEKAGPYIRIRVEAEQLFDRYVAERGLPGIAMNVANTYGPGDYAATPHGRLLWAAASGKLPFAVAAGLACVGVEDAADAMILAERKGRIGERYIVSDSWLTQHDLYRIAADQAGSTRRIRTMPLALLYALGFVADCVSTLRRRGSQLSVQSARLTHIINDMDATKARTELGWSPQPVERSIRAAVDFYRERYAPT
ncbi:NAD-dependent epimerase/dehydratase family protein [Sphingomonas jatrophae]|uniref:Dihydroflavonol-4-reductase n=1 Tax=Sphingomonas jatrophae TaxID=1166337 RepID=A0A1I6KFI0_9SPHN|nr:NAD-dependent epimerase/dehydratase family protein [Sphingomonas jatrophae]SFR90001.1 dihydroflavonol-4-reductase [Sphingomonas jatrophae]